MSQGSCSNKFCGALAPEQLEFKGALYDVFCQLPTGHYPSTPHQASGTFYNAKWDEQTDAIPTAHLRLAANTTCPFKESSK